MIDEKPLIEQLKSYKSEWRLAEPFHEGIAQGLQIAIGVIERQPQMTMPKEPQWKESMMKHFVKGE